MAPFLVDIGTGAVLMVGNKACEIFVRRVVLLTSLAIFLVSFLFPVGLYPYHDFSRDFLALFGSFLIFLFILFFESDEFSVPRHVVLVLFFLVLLLLSFLVSEPSIYISYNNYLFVLILAVVLSISISTMSSIYSPQVVLDVLLKFTAIVAVLSAFLALLRFYGVMKFLVPVVQSDGDRLIGPLGQPNLTAIVLAFGLVSVCYFRFYKKSISSLFYYSIIALIFYSGALTASRSWWLSVIIVSVVLFLFLAKHHSIKVRNFSVINTMPSLSLLIFLVVFSWVAPKMDSIVASPLMDSGFVERISAEELRKRLGSAGGSGRIFEWSKVVNGYDSIDNFWLGHGPGRYGSFSNKQELESGKPGNGSLWNHSHNIFNMFFVEWGFLGLVFISIFFFYCFFLCIRALLFIKDRDYLFFPSGIILILLAHSMVEFSLWYLPFFCLFLSALSLIDNSYSFRVSGNFFPKMVALVFSITFFPLGYYIAKDMYFVTKVMYSDESEFTDMWLVGDVSKSSIIGDKALMVLILRFPLMTSGVDRSLQQLDSYIKWRPIPLFMMRRASLFSRYRDRGDACHIIEESVKLYPEIVGKLNREIKSLNSDLNNGEDRIAYFQGCLEKGVNYWVNAGRDDIPVRDAIEVLELDHGQAL